MAKGGGTWRIEGAALQLLADVIAGGKASTGGSSKDPPLRGCLVYSSALVRRLGKGGRTHTLPHHT